MTAKLHEKVFRNLYYRLNGEGRRLCKCTTCGAGPMSIVAGAVSSEPCHTCEAVAWRELTEEEFASESSLSGFLTLHSAYLNSELESLGQADADSIEWTKFLEVLVGCLEGFGDQQMSKWLTLNRGTNREIIEYLLDERYTRDFLRNARKLVERTMRLEAMAPKATPEPGVNLYLREATRCCIAGYWESSVALSRTTLEFGLRQRLERQQFLPTDDRFEKLIEAAYLCRVLDHRHMEMAEDVRKHGNDVVHGSPANEDLAWHVLSRARGVLNHIYSQS